MRISPIWLIQYQDCYDQGYNNEGPKIVRMMLVTKAVIDQGDSVLAPFGLHHSALFETSRGATALIIQIPFGFSEF